jgi:anti-sigma factor RsiW
MIDITAHLRECVSCRELLDELKNVDALLATTRVPQLAENFTFAVMAEVRSMPAPRARQHPVWSFLVLYSAAAWVACVLAMVITHTGPAAVIAAFSGALSHAGIIASGVSANTAHGLAPFTPTLAAFGAGVLAIDFALGCAFALVYFVIRPRVVARLASVPESLS